HVGRSDARVQRGPSVLVARLGHLVLRATAHHLRLLRPGAGPWGRAARTRRRVTGRALRGLSRERRDRSLDRPPPRAGGTSAVGPRASGDRGARPQTNRRDNPPHQGFSDWVAAGEGEKPPAAPPEPYRARIRRAQNPAVEYQ